MKFCNPSPRVLSALRSPPIPRARSLADREAEPRSLFRGARQLSIEAGHEGFEDRRDLLLRNSHTRVSHADLKLSIIGFAVHRNGTAARSKFYRVRQKIEND